MKASIMETQLRKHAKLEIQDNIALIILNSPDSKVNVLNTEMITEFDKMLHKIETDEQIQAVVLISDKPGCFIAGADIKMLEKYQTAGEATQAAQSCQQILATIENSKKPVVAAIQGSCLGAGLETALACHYRIATKDKQTRFGLPEVLLGLLPGAGGTQRLQLVTSIFNVLDMVLTGKTITAEKAKQLGIIHLLIDPLPGLEVPERQMHEYLKETAISAAKKLVNGDLMVNRNTSIYDQVLNIAVQYRWVKDKIFNKAREQIMKQSGGLYPAPLKILDVVRVGVEKGLKAGFEAEAKAFGELMTTPQCKSLLSLFRAQTECKKNRFGEPQTVIKTIGVVGAGLMGFGIAFVLLSKGYNVILKDTTEAVLSRAIAQIQSKYEEAVKRKRYTSLEMDLHLSKLRPTVSYEDFHKLDMVIETAPEDITIKHNVLKELEAIVPSHCVIATSTSVIPVSRIAEESSRPNKIIGMHYIPPVDRMQFLEIVVADKTSKDTIAAATSVALKQGKTVITVRDSPGFYTTRIFTTMLIEAIRLLQEGVSVKYLNHLSKKFGFFVGIITLMDEIGLDVVAHNIRNLTKEFGERFAGGDCSIIDNLVNKGFLGKKSGEGFFMYDSKSDDCELNPQFSAIIKDYAFKPPCDFKDEDIIMRLVSRFVNEAVLCLQEKIILNPLEGNVGAVLGLGFPAFTGGPFSWINTYGAGKLVQKMNLFCERYGASFKPAEILLDMAKDLTKKFHSTTEVAFGLNKL